MHRFVLAALPVLLTAGCGGLDPAAALSALRGESTTDERAPTPRGVWSDVDRQGPG